MSGATKAGEKAILDAWHSFGKFIGAHMAPIAVACVVAACAFPAQLSHLAPAVPWLFALVSFQGALTNGLRNLVQAVRRPVPMLLTVAFASVVMPVVAFLLARVLFGSNVHLVTGIVLEYSVPVAAISTMWISMYGGNVAQGLSTLMVSSVIAPATIPATLQVLLGHAVRVDAGPMMLNVVLTVALPAVLGMGVGLLISMMSYFVSLIDVEWIKTILEKISFLNYYQNFTIGILSFTDVIFFLSVTALFLFFTVRALEKRRWS